MIHDMAALKQAMEQMDDEDPVVAQAAKDRAAQALSDAKLSFSKMGELIEQRRLLLRPRIVTNIKRMDQPGMLGDAAFRDAGSALRREGQSFRQIAEAIELNSRAAPRNEDTVQRSEPPPEMADEALYGPSEPMYGMPSDLRDPLWLRALTFVGSIVFFPFRHPMRFLMIAFVAFVLFYALRGIIGLGQQVPGHSDSTVTARQSADNVMSTVRTFINEQILRRPKETPTTSPAPSSSPSAGATSPPFTTAPAAPSVAQAPATVPTPSPNRSASPPAPPSAASSSPSAAPACPPASAQRHEVRPKPSSRTATTCSGTWEWEDRPPAPARRAPYVDGRARILDDIIPEAMRRDSRVAGPCVAGIGGCAWGGGRY
jgi:hypothetical protein